MAVGLRFFLGFDGGGRFNSSLDETLTSSLFVRSGRSKFLRNNISFKIYISRARKGGRNVYSAFTHLSNVRSFVRSKSIIFEKSLFEKSRKGRKEDEKCKNERMYSSSVQINLGAI